MNFFIKVSDIAKFDDGSYGEARLAKVKGLKDKCFDIRISRKKNRRLLVYVRTLVHEFLHIVFWLLARIHNYKVTNKSEHEFIEVIEDCLVAYWHILKRRY